MYSLGLKVSTHREEIGYPLDKYSVNCDISPNYQLFRKGGKRIRLVRGGKDCELNPENSELVGGQIMRYSKSKG